MRRIVSELVCIAAALVLASRPAEAQLKALPGRPPAPSLSGAGEWINTSGPIELRELRGKFVVLDFWTFCCINCMHILPELKRLERAYPDNVVVIGVHSAKFASEKETENIRQAVMRYEIEHPVVNDSELVLWTKYGVNVWPSLRVIDPEGRLIAWHAGEIRFEELDRFFKTVIPKYRAKRLLDETPLRFDLDAYHKPPTPLRYPGKVLVDEASGRLFISDSGNNRIVIASLSGNLLSTIGSSQIGRQDGDFATASFDHPQGMALRTEQLYVADTENHLIRKVDLVRGRVSTVAGNGQQARSLPARLAVTPRRSALASPWDLWLQGDDLFIAMAGLHQIWRMSIGDEAIGPYAGNGIEDIVDGPRLPAAPRGPGAASFAQPSGLACDGQRLFIADSEGSSIRVLALNGAGRVQTILGTAGQEKTRLFTFGDRDGPVQQALLQHPLGVAFAAPWLYVADTYNNKIKRIRMDRVPLVIETIVGLDAGLDEPSGLAIAGNQLFIADTNNHRICRVDLSSPAHAETLTIKGLLPPSTSRRASLGAVPDPVRLDFPSTRLRPQDGELRIRVQLDLPAGVKLNPSAPMSYALQAVREGMFPAEVLNKPIRIDPPATEWTLSVPVLAQTGETTLRISLVYYYCEESSEALCRIGSIRWTGRIELDPAATSEQLHLVYKAGLRKP